MLSNRFVNDGKPDICINQVQKCALYTFQKEIDSGIYEFEYCDCDCGTPFKNLITLGEKDRYGLNVVTKICPDCGMVMTNPRMTQKSYNRFYDLYYRKIYLGKRCAENEYFEKQQKHGKKIYEYINKNANLKNIHSILDIGCAAGGILSVFKEKGIEKCKGIDLGSEYIHFGIKKGLDLENCSSESLANREEKYDLIILSHVLEHFLNIQKELEIIDRLLSDHGVVYIEVPGIKNMNKDWYGNNFLRYLQNAHIRHFTYETLVQVMAWNRYENISGNDKIQSLFVKGKQRAYIKNFYNDVKDFIFQNEEEYIHSNSEYAEKKIADKNFDIMTILDCWMTINRNSKKISDYLYNKSIRRIAIYGMGILGRQLYEELKISDIEVCFVIDKREIEEIAIPVFKPEENFPVVDMIIMATTDEYTEIRRMIERNDIEIVPLAEIIYSLLFE